MTPTGVPISQADLISVSLPSVSATLASVVNLVALIRGSVAQQKVIQPSDNLETGASSDREDTESGTVMEELPAILLSDAPGALWRSFQLYSYPMPLARYTNFHRPMASHIHN